MTDKFSELLYSKLQTTFQPQYLNIINESHLHAGHREAGKSIHSHYRIIIRSDSFKELSKIAQHRAIYTACDQWLHNNPIHALAIEIQT